MGTNIPPTPNILNKSNSLFQIWFPKVIKILQDKYFILLTYPALHEQCLPIVIEVFTDFVR